MEEAWEPTERQKRRDGGVLKEERGGGAEAFGWRDTMLSETGKKEKVSVLLHLPEHEGMEHCT